MNRASGAVRQLPRVSGGSRLLAVVLAFSALVLAARAPAAAPPSVTTEDGFSVRLLVTAPDECATVESLQRKILQRSPRIRFVEVGEERIVRVEVQPQADRIRATLIVDRAGSPRAFRRVTARDCEEAVDALALVAALTLDPTSSGSEQTPSPSEQTPTPEGARTDAPSAAAPASTQPNPADRAGSRPSSGSSTEAVDAGNRFAPAAANAAFSAEIAAEGVARSGIAPGVLPGAGLGVEFRWGEHPVLAPAARMTAQYLRRGGFEAEAGTARFTLSVVTAELCPLRVLEGRFSLAPCFSATGGVLSAAGSRTNAASAASRPFWALGGSLRSELQISETFGLLCSAGLSRPLIRDRFQFRPEVFHRIEALSVMASLGLAYRLR